MNLSSSLLAALLVSVVPDVIAIDERPSCLSPDKRREAIATKKAIPLVRAMQAIKVRKAGDLIRARLCEEGRGLVYVLTVLGRDGKVVRARVDAATGQPIAGR